VHHATDDDDVRGLRDVYHLASLLVAQAQGPCAVGSSMAITPLPVAAERVEGPNQLTSSRAWQGGLMVSGTQHASRGSGRSADGSAQRDPVDGVP